MKLVLNRTELIIGREVLEYKYKTSYPLDEVPPDDIINNKTFDIEVDEEDVEYLYTRVNNIVKALNVNKDIDYFLKETMRNILKKLKELKSE